MIFRWGFPARDGSSEDGGVQLEKWGYPFIAGWFIFQGKSPSKMDDDSGYPHDELETPKLRLIDRFVSEFSHGTWWKTRPP